MAQSLSSVLVHFVFSTKDRFAFLTDSETRGRMHAYLARVFTGEDCPALEVGGTNDHVHVLCSLSRSHSMSEVIRKAKANSSGWAKASAACSRNSVGRADMARSRSIRRR